jgi:branched-chain amino acid transport system ATP-binding protein
VNENEIVSLLGRNGVGKTTTLRSIIGLNVVNSGIIWFKDIQISGLPPFKIIRLGIGYVPEDRRIFPDLTVKEHLIIADIGKKEISLKRRWTLDKIYSLFPKLSERESYRGIQLSGGEQQILAIARALMVNPELLILDEPTEGLAPLMIQEIGRIVKDIREDGGSILITEQNLAFAIDLADRHYIMEKGEICYCGMNEEFRKNDEVKERYLGLNV